MPNNSCTVILNGHGFYTSTKVINLNAATINYNIIFPCGLRESISAAHHNLILGTLASANPITRNLTLIEELTSTTIVNRNGPVSFMTDMDPTGGAFRVSSLVNEHVLTNAPDVVKAHSLLNFNQQPTTLFPHPIQRFVDRKVTHVANPTNFRTLFSNDGLYVEFDSIQICQDVLDAHSRGYSGTGIVLSQNNLLYIKPIAPRDIKINFLLSDFIGDILPKLKIVAIYHSNNSVDIIPTVFLDDNSDNTLQQQIGSSISLYPGDIYHELTIAGDANIVWDACRDLIA